MSDEQRINPNDPVILVIRQDIDMLSKSVQDSLQGFMTAMAKAVRSLDLRLTVCERALVSRGALIAAPVQAPVPPPTVEQAQKLAGNPALEGVPDVAEEKKDELVP